jgi:opacity protein-like surface antigen
MTVRNYSSPERTLASSLSRGRAKAGMTTKLLWIMASLLVAACPARPQRGIEITPFVGRQANGGIDLSTATFNHIDVANGLSYGISGVYPLGDYTGLEFMWNHNKADTLVGLTGGGTASRVLRLSNNQYLGTFVIHLKSREQRFRPFVFLGMGVANLSPDRSDAGSITRFAWAFGGGAKYYLSKHIGVRFQLKTSPTYIASGSKGFWCDPFWGGCWNLGENTFLQELDVSGGLTFRF